MHQQLQVYQFHQAFQRLQVDLIYQVDQFCLVVLFLLRDLEDQVDPEYLVCPQVLQGKKSDKGVLVGVP